MSQTSRTSHGELDVNTTTPSSTGVMSSIAYSALKCCAALSCLAIMAGIIAIIIGIIGIKAMHFVTDDPSQSQLSTVLSNELDYCKSDLKEVKSKLTYCESLHSKQFKAETTDLIKLNQNEAAKTLERMCENHVRDLNKQLDDCKNEKKSCQEGVRDLNDKLLDKATKYSQCYALLTKSDKDQE